VEVQYHLMKYSKTGSGRPVKKMIGEVAGRDRKKQLNIYQIIFKVLFICFVDFNDEL
jgi:hypothetical protein